MHSSGTDACIVGRQFIAVEVGVMLIYPINA